MILILLFNSVSYSAEIAFFNTEVLGKNTVDKINLLEGLSGDTATLIKPKVIQVDIEKGVYTSSSIYYSTEEIGVNEIVEEIDKKYPNSKNEKISSTTFWTWRVEDKQFVISFTPAVEDGMYRIIYVKFRNSTPKEMSEMARKALETINKNCPEKTER
jgi:hypothetical protein